jgi:hypothetical protein
MWEEYLEIAIRMTQENWPLHGTVMLLFVIPLMIFRVGRHSHLAAKGVKELGSKVEELQNTIEKLKSTDSGPVMSEIGFEPLSDEARKEAEAEKILDAFAKVSQDENPPQEVQVDLTQENAALASEEFSFDGNLAVDQPEFPPPVQEQVSFEIPQPEEEPKPAPVTPVVEKKDRNVVQCSKCSNKLAYKSEWAGKKVKCPSCKDVVALP